MTKVIKVVIVTNAPAPYRVPGWRRLAEAEDIHLDVIYCTHPHIDSTLGQSDQGFATHFLTGRYRAMERRFMHSDLGIWSLLNRLRPDVVITTGFIPTYLYAFAWAVLHRVSHVVLTDGTVQSEQQLSWAHRFIRRLVFSRSAAFVGSCEGSRKLFHQYGVRDRRIYLSELCADNDRFSRQASVRQVDFIFCGRFIAHKRPLFALQLAREVAVRLGRRTSIDFVGSGLMEPEMRDYAAHISDLVDTRFHGYVTQDELPSRYAQCRIFLFPSEWDPWGVVANEACASGLPVIVSPHAGVAGELVVDNCNGYVRELHIAQWADAAVSLLTDEALYERFSAHSRALVARYTFEHAAAGLADAIRLARPVRKVYIIQVVAKQYRLAFFDALYERMKSEGVELTVIYSEPNQREARREDSTALPETYGRKVRACWGVNYHVVYQACFWQIMAADLIIVEQANKHVLNYLLVALRVLGLKRVALWGHGRNWQLDGATWLEPVKRSLLTNADWWFAYTDRVARYVALSGFSSERITVVQNSIDTKSFRSAVDAYDAHQCLSLRDSMGISATSPIGLFCGSMHKSKMVGFLIEAAIKIKERVPNFELVLIGAGEEQSIASEANKDHNWIHFHGPLFGAKKAAYFAIADVFLCPGQVGLAVLEAFVAGLPFFTTNSLLHSPEIDYVTDHRTGIISDFDPASYADAVSAALLDAELLVSMEAAIRERSEHFGIDRMVDNFAQGVVGCLNQS